MALQGGSASLLQGGTGISLQGSNTNPQKTIPVTKLQPAITAQQLNVVKPSNLGYAGGGGADTAQTPVYTDPYAAWGGTSAYNRLVSGYDTQKQGILDSSNEAATSSGLGLQSSILDFIDSLKSGQMGIDNRNISNELAKQRGVSDVNNMVSTGVRSGGVKLANMNASDSSGAEGIARAYGQLGQRQLSDVGNQYETQRTEIGLSQDDLNRQRASGLRRFDTAEEAAVNSILADSTDKLTALDAAMANASLPERIAIDSEKQKIRGNVQRILAGYTKGLSGANNIRSMDQNAQVAEATRRYSMGQAPQAQFDYSADMPLGISDTGPVASELPIFTYRNRDQ